MIINFQKQRHSFLFRTIAFLMMGSFVLSSILPSQAFAQNLLNLPAPGTMVLPTPAFNPPMLRGMKLYADNPLRFDFILDTAKTNLEGEELKIESEKLIKYFLAALTVPQDDLWVNLSPYEKDRIIPEKFSYTAMGRDLLALDYLLKQLTASLMYPEDELGKKFWAKIYQKAYEQFGTTDIPVNTFNKVWIMPDKAVVYEDKDKVFIGESRLKVMLEEDYLALNKNMAEKSEGLEKVEDTEAKKASELSAQVVKEVIIPEIEKEVNEGENFAKLRQIYQSLILATWFKKNLKETFLGRVYADQNKVMGVEIEDKNQKEKIYEQYLAAYKKGVYDYIKEDYDEYAQEVLPRKYFSGGVEMTEYSMKVAYTVLPMDSLSPQDDSMKISAYEITADLAAERAGNDPVVLAFPKLDGSMKVAAKQADTSPEVSIAEKIPLIRLIPFLEGISDEDFLAIKNKIQNNGSVLANILSMPINALFVKDETTDLIEGQFPKIERSVVEIVSNGVDSYAKSTDESRSVVVRFNGKRQLSIRDHGIGMDLDVILNKLLIPQMSGKDALAGIGQFGIGFYSILNFLTDPGDQIVVKTGQGDGTYYRLIFTRENGEFSAQIETMQGIMQGTEVKIHLENRDFNAKNIQKVISEYFEFNLSSTIDFVNEDGQSTRINHPENYQKISVGKMIVGYSQEQAENRSGVVVVSVGGVKIFSLSTKGFNMPKTVIVNLSPQPDILTISRNALKVNKKVVENLQELVKGILLNQEINEKTKFSIFNPLSYLMDNLQRRNDSIFSEENLLTVLKNGIQKMVEDETSNDRVFLPDIDVFKSLRGKEDVILVNPKLFLNLMVDGRILKLLESKRIRINHSYLRVYLIDFNSLGSEFADKRFLLDRESKMLFLNASHFRNLEDSLQIEEIKTLLSGPIKGILGVKDELFESTFFQIADASSPKEKGPVTPREESRRKLQRVLLMREVSKMIRTTVDRHRSTLKKTQGLLDQPSAKQEIQDAIAAVVSVLSSQFPDIEASFIVEVVTSLISSMTPFFAQKGLSSLQIFEIVKTYFAKEHEDRLKLDYYQESLRQIQLYMLSKYQDLEDDVFADLSNRIVDVDIYRQLASAIEWDLVGERGMIGSYGVEDVVDAGLDSYTWVEFRMTDSLIKTQLLDLWHIIMRSLSRKGDTNVFGRLKGILDRFQQLAKQDEMFRQLQLDENVVMRYWQTEIDFIRNNLALENNDQQERISILDSLIGGFDREYLRGKHDKKDLTQKMEQIIEFLEYFKDYRRSALDMSQIYSGSSYISLRSWHITHLEFLNQILKTGNRELFINVINFTEDMMSLINYNRWRIIESELSDKEIEDNLLQLLDYFLTQNNKAEFGRVMREVSGLVHKLHLDFSKNHKLRLSPFMTPRTIRDYFIRVFVMKPGGIVKIEKGGKSDIFSAQYARTVYMSQFYHYFRKNPDAKKHIGFDGILSFLDKLLAMPLSDREKEIAGRRINQSIQHISPDGYIFLREGLQNTRDAVMKTPDADKIFDVNLYEETQELKKMLFVEMKDYVGMDFDILKNFLFVPGSSSKKEDQDLEGKYGVGFYTIFRDAKAVLLKTSLGKGEVIYCRMTPIFKEGTSEIIDVKIEIDPRSEEGFRGTIEQQVRETDFPEMVASSVQSRLISFGSVVDPNEVVVRASGKEVNLGKKEFIAEIETKYGTMKAYHLPGENTLTHRGFYLNEIDEDYERLLGDGGFQLVREYLLEEGIVIDLPEGTQPIKDRSDIKNRDKVLFEIGPQLRILALQSLIRLFVAQKIQLAEIPYDIFIGGSNIHIDSWILNDAQKVFDGKVLDENDLTRYMGDSEKVMMLLISIPIYGGRSILQWVKAFISGEVSVADLPEEIKTLLPKQVGDMKQIQDQQAHLNVGANFGRKSQGYLGDLKTHETEDLAFEPLGLDDPRSKGFERYFGLIELVNQVGYLITGRQFFTRFYSQPDGSIAHAGRANNYISWNLYAIDRFAKLFETIINSANTEVMRLYEILELITHEIAHVREGGKATHHDKFYEVQFVNIDRILAQEEEFREFLRVFKQKYRGTLSDQKSVKDFSELILTSVTPQEVMAEQEVVSGPENENSTAPTSVNSDFEKEAKHEVALMAIGAAMAAIQAVMPSAGFDLITEIETIENLWDEKINYLGPIYDYLTDKGLPGSQLWTIINGYIISRLDGFHGQISVETVIEWLRDVNKVKVYLESLDSSMQISKDSALISAERANGARIEREGGINFNPENLNLETRGRGIDIPQVDMKQLESMQIDGFVPIIINIMPIGNLRMFLGLSDQEEKPGEAATTPSPTPKEISKRELPAIRERELVSELNELSS